ncbi:MAG TPA: hypothetical protein PLA53_00695 [bacterium]|jgi:hypothetical protein|nr:hypothetical protein [bacterium]HNZ51467.1 hypothetical protein [bacterium]HOF79453.1 hypothetical protein [bacterium]HOH85276.1 hypothetical protein [bacterium]HOQ91829.1 hypothetical protein [bacterium]
MPQEQLKPSFEQMPLNNSQERQPTAEKITESAISEAAPVTVEPVVNSAAQQPPAITASQPTKLTVRQEAIDDILEDGLADIYQNLPPDKQQELKQAGERTVHQIDRLLDHAKSQLTKIISLIRRFLAIIPGVNRFFLEQEVKIKTDKIMALKDK